MPSHRTGGKYTKETLGLIYALEQGLIWEKSELRQVGDDWLISRPSHQKPDLTPLLHF